MIEDTAVPAVKLIRLPLVVEARGSLTYGEVGAHLPFVPLRYFLVFDVPAGRRRGEHAHLWVSQALVCLRGTVAVAVDDGRCRDEVTLDDPTRALLLPPRVWATQTFSAGAMLLVLCSERYNADDYVRDYGEFIEMVSRQT